MTTKPAMRVELLDSGFVELLHGPQNGDSDAVSAARVSYLGESKGPEMDERLVLYLMKNRHTSPFEMADFKFRVRAPLLVYWQWLRHRTFKYMSVNSQSGRFREFSGDDFYLPTEFFKQHPTNKQMASLERLPESTESDFSARLLSLYTEGYALYAEMLEAGVARERARLALPGFAVYYTWIMKVDAHNLMNFLDLRMASDAQSEIREYANALHEMFSAEMPITAQAFDLYRAGKSE